MTPAALAHLHARAMLNAWSSQTFADLLPAPGVFLTVAPSPCPKYAPGEREGGTPSPTATGDSQAQSLKGFALGRATLDEAELLTLAVDPDHQRQGHGHTLLAVFEARASRRGCKHAFLEVSAGNAAARRLYQASGWVEIGRRPAYYRTENGREDAILMQKSLETP